MARARPVSPTRSNQRAPPEKPSASTVVGSSIAKAVFGTCRRSSPCTFGMQKRSSVAYSDSNPQLPLQLLPLVKQPTGGTTVGKGGEPYEVVNGFGRSPVCFAVRQSGCRLAG